MKKLTFLALVTLLVAGSAFAQVSLDPFTIAANDATCDIAVTPAATLLLPYFEVGTSTDTTVAVNTLFTITNTTNMPAIAHITIWSNWSYPVIDFNIFLTGYDVQSINLHDILVRATIPATSSTSTTISPRGSRSITTNPSIVDFASCATLPGPIDPGFAAELRSGLTGGPYGDCLRIGDTSQNMIGYVTVDISSACTTSLPIDETYFASEVRYDNWLIGDYQLVNPSTATGNYAGGNPMVHIRAIPAGNNPTQTGLLPVTFYERYSPTGADRRQPLPALFAARFIEGGVGAFNTRFLIWREGITQGTDILTTCGVENAQMPYVEAVRFDERENPTTLVGGCSISPCREVRGTLPETSAVPTTNTNVIPPFATGSTQVGGWVYWNLHNNQTIGGTPAFDRASQNWVVVDMRAEGRYGVDFDAAFLANGCTPIEPLTGTTNPIGIGY
jgi:hypothetical protein